MYKAKSDQKNKTLKDFEGDFEEELDLELRKLTSLKEKLLYLYQLKRENESHNVKAGGFYYYGMVILNKLKYYDTALQYNKTQEKSLKNSEKKFEVSSKIIWKKSKEELLELIGKLIDLGFIGYERDKNDLITEHFVWLSEKPTPKLTENNNYKIIRNNDNNSNNPGIKTFLETFEKRKM